MTQHYTRSTVEASAWCKRCGKMTMHRIDGVKLGPCLPCMEKQRKEPEKKPPEQLSLLR